MKQKGELKVIYIFVKLGTHIADTVYIASFLLLEASLCGDHGHDTVDGGFFFRASLDCNCSYGTVIHMIRRLSSYMPFILFVCIVLWWGFSMQDGVYDWQWRRAFRYVLRFRDGQITFGPLLQGLWLTICIVGVSLFLSVVLGLVTAILRYTPLFVGRNLAAAYVGLVRNTPLLIQLFIMYFVIAPVFGLSPFWAAVWALALFEGAYMAEVFRAGIGFIPQGQLDAAHSFGFSRVYIFIHIVLPQALRKILPPLSSQTVSLIKDSALVSAIALPDLTMQAQVVIAETFLSLELWVMVAAIYLLLTLIVSIPAKLLERYYAWQWA